MNTTSPNYKQLYEYKVLSWYIYEDLEKLMEPWVKMGYRLHSTAICESSGHTQKVIMERETLSW